MFGIRISYMKSCLIHGSDSDSVRIRRLRAEGFQVVECTRPRSRQAEASLTVNY